MTKSIKTASPDEPIKKVVARMERYGIKEIPIVENKKLVGMITYYDILDFVRADPNEKVSTLMIKPPIIAPDTPIGEIIELMVKTGVEAVPVIDKEKIIGLVSDYDILLNMLNDSKIRRLKVRDVMDESTKLLKETDPISEARRIMRYHRWERLPIVDSEGKLIGMITSMDILRTFYKMPKEKMGRQDKSGRAINPLMMPVKSLMEKDIPEIHPKDKVSETLKKLIDKKLKGVPVVDEENKVIGMFERWNVLDKLIERKFKEGVWLKFSGFPLSIETVEILKDYLKSDIKKMKIICPDLVSIDIHIKKLHGATPKKWNYEVNVHLITRSGKGAVVTNREAWYGYNLMFTLQDAFNRLISQLEKNMLKERENNTMLLKEAELQNQEVRGENNKKVLAFSFIYSPVV